MTTITVVLDPPQPSDTQETFNNKAFATLGSLNTWATQANTVAGEVSSNTSMASSAASTASTAASTATTKAGEASTSASNAAGSASSAGTSATNAENSASAAAASATAASNSAIDAANNAASVGFTLASSSTLQNKTMGSGCAWQGTAVPVAYGGSGASDAKTARSNLGIFLDDTFYKADPTTVAFTKTGAGTASIKAGTRIGVVGTVITFAADTAITMPSLTAGTDYAIWVKDDATIQATTNFSSAPGAGNWRKIGGFHYAPGGNATGVAGGDTTPAINAYSLWDLKFRPACADPRGMALVAESFWADIYLLGVDHLTNGTSKYNVPIADGSSPPKIPTKFGGNGSTAYSTLNWWEANEVLQSWGKRSPTYDEFAALAYGTTEATSSGGTDVPTTGVTGTGATSTWNKFTSKWGVIQASGCLWVWGGEFGGGAAAASWTANTGGRGSTYQMENAVVFGGDWGGASNSGSRASGWFYSPTASYSHIGARGVCDHLIID